MRVSSSHFFWRPLYTAGHVLAQHSQPGFVSQQGGDQANKHDTHTGVFFFLHGRERKGKKKKEKMKRRYRSIDRIDKTIFYLYVADGQSSTQHTEKKQKRVRTFKSEIKPNQTKHSTTQTQHVNNTHTHTIPYHTHTQRAYQYISRNVVLAVCMLRVRSSSSSSIHLHLLPRPLLPKFFVQNVGKIHKP